MPGEKGAKVSDGAESGLRRAAGKVALITGAARGQGREHAIALAHEGADIIAIDICSQISTVRYDMSAPADLETTERLIRAAGGRVVARQADVRSLTELEDAVRDGVGEFGRLDIVIANAGIGSGGRSTMALTEPEWEDVIGVNLSGVWRTLKASVPIIIEGGRGGSIVITGSTAGLRGMRGIGHYAAAKHGLVGLAKTLAIELADANIRVNCVHPTGVRTPLAMSPLVQKWAAKRPPATAQNLMPVDMIEPGDVTNAILWLVSDQARYITGIGLPVDAGFTL
jgi:SDR family mycofactocin-dependent oxidoreductase